MRGKLAACCAPPASGPTRTAAARSTMRRAMNVVARMDLPRLQNRRRRMKPLNGQSLPLCGELLILQICIAPPLQHISQHSAAGARRDIDEPRSEEHTSELQSHSDLVCRLLLEKKKSMKSARSWFA